MPLRLHSIDRQFAHFCRTGDAEALGRVFDAAAAELLHVAAWLSGNRADAEDLLQRTFLTAIEDRAAFANERRVMPWLMVILTNHARNLRRERARCAGLPAWPERTADPVALANDAEFAERLASAHAAIGAPYAEVLALHLEQGWNAKEIAARLRRPEGTVRTQLTRGLERLRQRLPEGFVAAQVSPGVEPAAFAAMRATVLDAARNAALVSVAGALATGGMVLPKKLLTALAAVLLLLFGVSLQQGWLDANAIPAPPVVAAESPVPQETGLSASAMPTPSRTAVPEPAADPDRSRDVAQRAVPRRVRLFGSSAVFAIAAAAAEKFHEAKKGAVEVTVDISDSDDGFRRFARSETDIANASRPISKAGMEACIEGGVEYIELPICFDVLTVVVNPEHDWVSSITVEELDKIWHERLWEPGRQGKITYWNQIRPEWPAEKLVLFGAANESAAADYFAEAICGILSGGNFTASEKDGVVVQGIDSFKYALGYLRYGSYEARKDRLKALAIEWPKNSVRTPVLPSAENVLKGIYKPLSRPLFLYVNRKAGERREVAEFVEFFLENAEKLANEVKYLPLPAEAYPTLLQRFLQQQCGTCFGGQPEVALTIDALLLGTPVSVPTKGSGHVRMGR